MGNTSTSLNKEASENKQSCPAGHNLALRDRFDELAVSRTSETGEIERFVLFESCSKLAGPRGGQVAARLYRVLDSGGDGMLDFNEFSSAACLLKGSPDEQKLKLLFKMYGDASKGGLVGREGLRAFILDMIAASPPPSAPPDYRGTRPGGIAKEMTVPHPARTKMEQQFVKSEEDGRDGHDGHDGHDGNAVTEPDFEVALAEVLDKMTAVVLTQFDGDGDGMLSEKEWRAYLKGEEQGVVIFLSTLSESVGKLLVQQ